MTIWRRLRTLARHPSALAPRLRGAVTLMAFTDSGWVRRCRVPRVAVTIMAAFLAALTLATILSVSFAVWAGLGLRHLHSVERENRSLTTQLQEQAGQLTRLKIEMSRLRELEKSLRAVSGLAQPAEANEGSGKGGVSPAPPR